MVLATKGSAGAAGIVLLLPILGLVFSAMGMKASKAAGEKRGLAIAGLVIAIVDAISMAWNCFYSTWGNASSYNVLD
jgi:hypothetical protein